MAPFKGRIRQQNGKLFTTDSGDQILALDGFLDGGGDHPEDIVTHQMAVGVVDFLKVIDIGNDQAKGCIGGACVIDGIDSVFFQIPGGCQFGSTGP